MNDTNSMATHYLSLSELSSLVSGEVTAYDIRDNFPKYWADDQPHTVLRVQVKSDYKGGEVAHEHSNWVADRQKNGWVYGEKRDDSKKVHPCITSYENLDPAIKVRDYLVNMVMESSHQKSA